MYLYVTHCFFLYDQLYTSSCSFITKIYSLLIPKTVGEALAHLGWCAAMIEDMMPLIILVLRRIGVFAY